MLIKRRYDAGKPNNAHQAAYRVWCVDALGLLLVVLIIATGVQDRDRGRRLLERHRPEGYSHGEPLHRTARRGLSDCARGNCKHMPRLEVTERRVGRCTDSAPTKTSDQMSLVHHISPLGF